MRQKNNFNGITCAAYSGSTGIMLAFDIEKKLKKKFLGFAIKRSDERKTAWLQGLLHFEEDKNTTYIPIDSNLAPIQKFRWSDYCVYPGNKYKYSIFAVHGTPECLSYTEGPCVEISTEKSENTSHEVVFNRAVAASQAYEKKFGDTKPNDESNPQHVEARKWLARGIDEKLFNFMLRAKDKTYSLDIAIYEFELEEIAEILNSLAKKKVEIRVLYHAKNNDPQTAINQKTASMLHKSINVKERITSKIFHHKYAVLRQNGKAISVLSGSTNFTNNALYLQANVLHIMNDELLAEHYEKQFDRLWENPAEVKDIKTYNSESEIEPEQGIFSYFSPRKNGDDLEKLVSLIANAKQNFFICSAFDIHPDIENIISNHPNKNIIRYGLQNSKSALTGYHRNSIFTVPGFLKEGLGKIFLKESTKRKSGEGSIYIHLKTMVIDFAGKNPLVVFGSHNFSQAASASNDENMIIIENNPELADTYMIEMFRLYDHYRFRFNQNEKKSIPSLCNDDSWCADYFDQDNIKCAEKKMLCGG